MVLKNVENKIKLVTIVCSIFLVGCVVISLGSIFTARNMVADAHKQIYVLDSNVPILVKQTPEEVTLDIEAKADIDMPEGKRLLQSHHGYKHVVQHLL